MVAPPWYRWTLAGAFLALAAALAWAPPGGRFNWVMGNIPTAVALGAFGWAFVRHPLSWWSSTLLWAFLALHEVGVHHGYRVPWEAVEAGRNQYDRVVHVAFGLLLTTPLREVLVRARKADGRWADLLAVLLVLAFAAAYEVLEWVGAELFWPGPAEDFLGHQGDPLDATKDMALALGGSLAAIAASLAGRFALRRRSARRQSTR